ncbi:uncharacterized protein PGTG_11492 [Puccinia graminis f. sp. tritici CRL 75-36-700-3]|uniref:RING-type domain-containing protein n=1 Tax=Puccinia graminis f. sp. tritici (strain CRL 75-36-700-3 / race SCCL) TaxID=418459 RepID=E3KLX4_PUCGT|nr:uncharacterized protein PGTG_11492 [Puccinia graminis f. sp. tritici CRL 75-36-700-3]EFP85323.1 hypothetical protein PGTG_11492 [Puccinia graminis f. sp. tritici CRL 75-36-700-3]
MLIGSTRETSPKNNELTFNIDLFSCYVWTQNLPDHFARNFLVNRVLSAPNPPTRNPSQPALDFELSRVVIPEVAIIGMGTSQTDKDRPIPIRIPARTLYTPDSFGTPRTIMERTSEKFHLFVPNLTKDQLRHIDVSVSTRRRSKLSPEEHQLLVPNLTREQRKSIAIQDHFAISDTSAEKYLFVPYLSEAQLSHLRHSFGARDRTMEGTSDGHHLSVPPLNRKQQDFIQNLFGTPRSTIRRPSSQGQSIENTESLGYIPRGYILELIEEGELPINQALQLLDTTLVGQESKGELGTSTDGVELFPTHPSNIRSNSKISHVLVGSPGHDSCSTCQEIFKKPEKGTNNQWVIQKISRINNCKHYFHFECLVNWVVMANKNSCPICRLPVDIDKI